MKTYDFRIDTDDQKVDGKLTFSFSKAGKLEVFFQSIDFRKTEKAFYVAMREVKKIIYDNIIERLNSDFSSLTHGSYIWIDLRKKEEECPTTSLSTDVDSAETLSL